MLVAASTHCFKELPLLDACSRLVDLEYTNVEIVMSENTPGMEPSWIASNLEQAFAACHNPHRLNVVAYDVDIAAEGDEGYKQFSAICKLAKATKVVSILVPSAEHGTPFNEEVERLRKLVDIASLEGVRVGMKCKSGCLSSDVDTIGVLCDNVKGLGICFDPSYFVDSKQNIEKLMKYVYHVHLRDSTADELQVRIGKGKIDYGRIVSQLEAVNYNRALCVHMTEIPDTDHMVEMRKMRRLLESLL